MKISILMACVLLSFTAVEAAQGTGTAAKKSSSVASSKAKLGTSFRLDGSTLRGQYQTSLGTNATVENDKYLDDLLGGRKNFQDRIQEDNNRN